MVNLAKKFRDWIVPKTKFEVWMEANHPSLEYEYNTRYLEWIEATNKQKWRTIFVLGGMIVGAIGFMFGSFEAGLAVGASVCIVTWIFSAWARTERLKEDMQEVHKEVFEGK